MNKEVNNRIKKNWNEFKKDIIKAKENNPKETFVENMCKRILISVFGYDQNSMNNQDIIHYLDAVDFVIKDTKTNKIMWVVECKKIKEDINKEKWIKQIKKYCLESKTNWGILTNGFNWSIYYLDNKKEPVTVNKVYEITDITELSDTDSDISKLYPFTREALGKGEREKLLKK